METETVPVIITGNELIRRLSGNQPIVIIDTLPEAHFLERHIDQAINACVFEVVFVETVKAIVPDRHQTVVVYGFDNETHDGRVAAWKLMDAGYSDVLLLDGGLQSWADAGFPLAGRQRNSQVPHLLPVIADGAYTVDTDVSVVEWAGRNPNGKHFGTVRIADGRIRVQNGVATGSFTLDMAGIQSTDLMGDQLQKVLIDHLTSDDFFFVSRYPTAVFGLTEMVPVAGGGLSGPNYHARGHLSLRGVEASVEFQPTVSGGADGSVSAEAHFDIDRTRWGVIYGSSRFFKHLGKHLVFDVISLQLQIVARPESAGR